MAARAAPWRGLSASEAAARPSEAAEAPPSTTKAAQNGAACGASAATRATSTATRAYPVRQSAWVGRGEDRGERLPELEPGLGAAAPRLLPRPRRRPARVQADAAHVRLHRVKVRGEDAQRVEEPRQPGVRPARQQLDPRGEVLRARRLPREPAVAQRQPAPRHSRDPRSAPPGQTNAANVGPEPKPMRAQGPNQLGPREGLNQCEPRALGPV